MKQQSNRRRVATPGQKQARHSSRASTIRVLLAESHALLRAGMRTLIDKLPQVEVVAEADQSQKILKMIRRRRPRIVLLSLGMIGSFGLALVTRIVTEFPDVKVVMILTRSNDEYVNHAIRAGVSGLLLKDATPMELRKALLAVASGKLYLSSDISKNAIRLHLRRGTGQPSPQPELTPRQAQILELITNGKTTKEIAHALNLSSKTVEAHRIQLMRRLNIYSIPGLVRYAIRTGLTTLEN